MSTQSKHEVGVERLVARKRCLSHDFVVPDDKLSSLLPTTDLILIGQHQQQPHVILSVGSQPMEPLASRCMPGKNAVELFTGDGKAAALEASWHDNDAFCSHMCIGGDGCAEFFLCSASVPGDNAPDGSTALPSHILLLKPRSAPEVEATLAAAAAQAQSSPANTDDSQAILREWAACTCVVSIPADPEAVQAPLIQAVSRQFAQQSGHTVMSLVGSTFTSLCGPGTFESSIQSVLTMVNNCITGSSSSRKGCQILLYRRTGEPWIANVRAVRYPAPAPHPNSQDANNSSSKNVSYTCLLCIANVTATACPVVADITLGRVLGSGAFGTVHIGKKKGFDADVAVKVVNCGNFRDLTDLDAMRNEIAVMATLRHPHIIDLLDSAYVGDRIFIVLEFAPGGDLKDHIQAQAGGKLGELEAQRLFCQCVAALLFCQRRRVCHRDLKPENILLDAHKNVKIADFGLASIVKPGAQLLQYCGTPAFSAPELFGKEHYEVNPADIWSLGVVLYECLTGKLPFKAVNQEALVKKIRSGKYPALPASLSADVSDLLGRMLKVDPEERISIEEITTHNWYLTPPGCSGLQDLTLEGLEDSGGPNGPGSSQSSMDDNINHPGQSSNPNSPVSPTPLRRLQHLHSSVCVSFDDSDLDLDEEAPGGGESTATCSAPHPSPHGSNPSQSVSDPVDLSDGAAAPVVLPPSRLKILRGKCPSLVDGGKGAIGKGNILQDLKSPSRKTRVTHFSDKVDGATAIDSRNEAEAGETSWRLPKLGDNRARPASTGGVLNKGGAVGNPQGVNGGASAGIQLPSPNPRALQRQQTLSSAPGEIRSTGAVEKLPPHSGPSTRGIPASS